MRKLKHHEQRLLKKVDFLAWKGDDNLRENRILRKYAISRREDYAKYNRVAGMITALVAKLKALPPDSQFRVRGTEALLAKLFNMGLVSTAASLDKAEHIPASAFCRRRLPVVMARLKMAESLRDATGRIEQGHVRVGPEVVTDPAFLVTRTMEDFVTWVDGSKVKRVIAAYQDALDDYDLLGE